MSITLKTDATLTTKASMRADILMSNSLISAMSAFDSRIRLTVPRDCFSSTLAVSRENNLCTHQLYIVSPLSYNLLGDVIEAPHQI